MRPPTPLGAIVTAKATVSAVEGRKSPLILKPLMALVSLVTAHMNASLLTTKKFMAKVASRAKSN